VKTLDEQVLQQRLREEISRLETGPVPADAVLRRGKAIRARRRAVTVSGAAALAVAVAVSTAIAGVTPSATHPSAPVASGGHPGTKNIWNLAHPGAPGGVFVSGIVNGRPWRLAVGNIAGQAPWCLPAVLLNGADAGLLPIDSTATPVGDPSFLTDVPGWPGIGFAFIQVPPGVTEVTADLPGGVSLGVPPVTVTLCGERFRLAGFGFADPHRGVADISVRLASGRTNTFYPSPGLFSQDSGTPGVWVSLNRVTGDAGSGVTGSGAIGGTSWQVSMTLGPAGQCFTLSASLGGTSARASDCVPIEAPPAGVSLEPLPLAMPTQLTGWAGIVSPRAAYLVARLSDGRTQRLMPVDIGGRKYFGLALGNAVTVAGLTVYDARGHAFGTATSAFAVK
jgi:hypothetical protein